MDAYKTTAEHSYSYESGSMEQILPHSKFPYLKIMDRQNAILYVRARNQAALYSLSSGEEMWHLEHERDYPGDYDRVRFADVSPDGKTLVLAILDAGE